MESGKKWLRRAVDSPLVLALLLFMLSLGPRILDLAVFVAPDEFYWVSGCVNFARALASGELEKTYHAGQPGVTLMWVETLGAWLRFGVQWLRRITGRKTCLYNSGVARRRRNVPSTVTGAGAALQIVSR